MTDNIGEVFVKIKADVSELTKEVQSLKAKMDKDAEKLSNSFAASFKNGLKLAGGFIGIQTALNFGKKIIQTASEFEQLRTRLVSLYGSVDKATTVFEQFKKIAATTPFSLKEVVEAGSTLKAFGMNAEDTLKSVTDLAAYMGMNVTEAASAVGRAFSGGVGAADILRERGVLNLIKSFKGVDDLTKLTLPQFREALIESMQNPTAGIAGSTDRMSKTFSGSFSNMMDSVENFSAAIGTKLLPFINKVTQGLGNLFSTLTPVKSNIEDVTEKALEQRTSFELLVIKYERLRGKAEKTNEEGKEYSRVISELQTKYPTLLTNLDLQKSELEDVRKGFEDVRKEMEKNIRVELRRAKAKDLIAEQEGLIESRTQYQQEADALQAQIRLREQGAVKDADVYDKATQTYVKKSELLRRERKVLEQSIKDFDNEIKGLQGKIDTTLTASGTPEIESGGGGGGGGRGDKLSILRENLKLMEEFKLGTKEWYDLSVAMIKAEAEEAIKAGTDKELVRLKEIKQLKELSNYYERIKKQQDLTNLPGDLRSRIPENLEGVERPERSEPFDQYKPYRDMAENYQGPFSDIDGLETSLAAANGLIDGFFENITVRGEWANSMLEKAFASMADAVIGQIQRIAAEWLAMQAMQATFQFLGIPLPAATGGTFQNGKKIASFAGGGSFTVPQGFPNDSYPMLVQSGERVTVTPTGRVGETEKLLASMLSRFDVLNYNLIQASRSGKNSNNINVNGKLDGMDIYLSNKKATRITQRYTGSV